jgi:hypothetical protein
MVIWTLTPAWKGRKVTTCVYQIQVVWMEGRLNCIMTSAQRMGFHSSRVEPSVSIHRMFLVINNLQFLHYSALHTINCILLMFPKHEQFPFAIGGAGIAQSV